jgi:hypothetical protein
MERKHRIELQAGDDPPGPNGITCGQCRHFADVGTGGECREDSPTGALIPDGRGGVAATGFWPSTRKEKWCGKHAPRPPAANS